jgi:hypothetical protein
MKSQAPNINGIVKQEAQSGRPKLACDGVHAVTDMTIATTISKDAWYRSGMPDPHDVGHHHIDVIRLNIHAM